MKEFIRPWKLFSLACGLALLIAGSFYYQAPDWDISICFIMGIATYLTAPYTLRVVLERRWKELPWAALATYVSVDGLYFLYWNAVNPMALEYMRGANALASLSLYLICGVVWLHKGSLKTLPQIAK